MRLLLTLGFVFSLCFSADARSAWVELNIGPFYVDTDGDPASAREALTQMEQLRWVLGGLLESQDLRSVWPIRVMLSNKFAKTNPNGYFVSQNGPPLHSQNLLILPLNSRVPLDQIAAILLNDNTPKLPDEVESGLLQLLGSIQARGSRVTWGGAPAYPDLAWARMQLFATKFEYSTSFHIFLTNVRSVTIPTAERNTFGKDPSLLESEARANLAAHNWQAVSVPGRPLDPKRDFGEHTLDATFAAVYLADADLDHDPKTAEAAYNAAVSENGTAAALGFEGLARVALLEKQNPKPALDSAIDRKTASASVYLEAAAGVPEAEAIPLLKKAAQLNPAWAAPLAEEAKLVSDAKEKTALLRKATQLDPRGTEFWVELAQVQGTAGEGTASQGSWLRAEDSTSTAAERNRVHQLRLDSEKARLDAAEAAERREREAPHLADERAERSEAARIRAAEKRANAALDSEAGGTKPESVVPWSEVVPQKKISGKLIKVDCLGSDARITVSDKPGSTIRLLLKNVSESGLSCSDPQRARRVSVTYSAQPDDRFGTAGSVTALESQ